MKLLSVIIACFACIILLSTACKKYNAHSPHNPASARKVQFILYTSKDFSTDNHLVTFTAFIRNQQGRILWDSALAPMHTKDIPTLTNKILAEKGVPGNTNETLKVGFEYYITNVGYSWHMESFTAGSNFKTVIFNFQ